MTQQTVLRQRILLALLNFDGYKARRKDLLAELDRRYQIQWTPEDRQPPFSRPSETNWENRASFERANMVRDGLLQPSSNGFWALSSAGVLAAQQL